MEPSPDERWFTPSRPPTWTEPRLDRPYLLASVGAIAAVGLLLAAALILYGPGPSAGGGEVPVALSLAPGAAPTPIPSTFWGANVGLSLSADAALTQAVERSPVHVIRYPGGAAGDAFNFTSGLVTNDSGVAHPAVENLSEFVAWCRSVACAPILELPGEIDSPATAAYYVAYTEATFHLKPIAWEIGNEPALWTHFGFGWTSWSLAQHVAPTPVQYAQEVRAYIVAIHRVDPTAPILGLPGVGTGAFQETAWVNATVALNGPNVSGIGIHVYPAGPGPGSSPTVSQFLQNASGSRSLGARVLADQQAIAAADPARPDLPVYVTELGTGSVSGSFAPYLYSFPTVPFIASEIVAAIASGVASVELTQVATPHGGSWMDGNDSTHPLLALYAELLPLLGNYSWPLALTPSMGGLYALVTTAGPSGRATLLVVNANATTTALVDLASSGLDLASSGQRWLWAPTSPGPLVAPLSNVPDHWTVAPTSLLLIQFTAGLLPATHPAGPRSPVSVLAGWALRPVQRG